MKNTMTKKLLGILALAILSSCGGGGGSGAPGVPGEIGNLPELDEYDFSLNFSVSQNNSLNASVGTIENALPAGYSRTPLVLPKEIDRPGNTKRMTIKFQRNFFSVEQNYAQTTVEEYIYNYDSSSGRMKLHSRLLQVTGFPTREDSLEDCEKCYFFRTLYIEGAVNLPDVISTSIYQLILTTDECPGSQPFCPPQGVSPNISINFVGKAVNVNGVIKYRINGQLEEDE